MTQRWLQKEVAERQGGNLRSGRWKAGATGAGRVGTGASEGYSAAGGCPVCRRSGASLASARSCKGPSPMCSNQICADIAKCPRGQKCPHSGQTLRRH